MSDFRSLPRISEAYYQAVEAVASVIPDRPLPPGLNIVETDDWRLALNNSSNPVDFEGSPLPPYNLFAQHQVYFLLVVLAPDGGIIGGGMPEQEFIDQMKALASVDTLPKGQDSEAGLVRSKGSAVGAEGDETPNLDRSNP